MADFAAGDVLVRLRADATAFQQAIQRAIQQLQQLTQTSAQVRQAQTSGQQATTQQTRAFQELSQAVQRQSQAYTQGLQATNALTKATQVLTENLHTQAGATKQASSAWSAMLSVAGGIGIATSIGAIASAMANFGASVVDTGTKLQQLRSSLSAIAGSPAAGVQQFQQLFETAQRLGLAFEPLARGWRSLTAAASQTNLPLTEQQRLLTAVSTEARRVGISTEEFSRLMTGLAQTASKGKVSMEELRQQIGEALPTAFAAVARGMGRTTEELEKLVSSGSVRFPSFARAITRGLEEMQAKSGAFTEGAQESFNRLGNAATAFRDALAKNVLPELQRLAGWAQTILETATKIINITGGRGGGGQPLGPGLGDLGATANQQKEADRLRDFIERQTRMIEHAPDQEIAARITKQRDNAKEQLEQLTEAVRTTQDQVVVQEKVTAEVNKTAAAQQLHADFLEDVRKKLADVAKAEEDFRKQAAVAPERFGRLGGSLEDVEKYRQGRQKALGEGLDALSMLVANPPQGVGPLPAEEQQKIAGLSKEYGNLGKAIDAAREAESARKKAIREAEQEAEQQARKRLQALKDIAREEEQQIEQLRRLEAQTGRSREERQEETAATLAANLAQSQYGAEAEQLAGQVTENIRITTEYKDIVQELKGDFERIIKPGLAFTEVLEDQLEVLRALPNQALETKLRLQALKAGISITPEQETLIQANVLQDRFNRDRATTQQLQEQLDQLATPRDERGSARARRIAMREGRALTEEQEAIVRQIAEQERLNQIVATFETIGVNAAGAITTALTSMIERTQSVGQAFAQMTQSILQSTAQILLNEGFRTLIRLGIGAAFGAFAPTTVGMTTPGGGLFQAPAGGGIPFTPPPMVYQHGGVVNKPTHALIGENPAHNPEFIFNRQQMQSLMRAGPTAGGQAAGVTIINVANRVQAEAEAARERTLGRSVIINEVLSELSKGESSSINRMIRTLSR